MEIRLLILEVTRRCQLRCAHCLRGEPQVRDVDEAVLRSLAAQVSQIDDLTFSGGEPSLNVGAMRLFRELCSDGINVGRFYVATNGVKESDDFVLECLRWRRLCEDKENCMVQVSDDMFHREQRYFDPEDSLLFGLGFASYKGGKPGYDYGALGRYGDAAYLRMGLARENLSGGRTLEVQLVRDKREFDDAEIYVNVEGDVINGCDWSYDEQPAHRLCGVDELEEFYESLPDEYEE